MELLSEADACQRHLVDLYLNDYSEIQLDPGDPSKRIHVKDIYTNLELLQDNKRSAGKIRKPIEDYNELFTTSIGDQRLFKRLIIRGDPGKGKTTLAHKMAYDWAEKIHMMNQDRPQRSTDDLDAADSSFDQNNFTMNQEKHNDKVEELSGDHRLSEFQKEADALAADNIQEPTGGDDFTAPAEKQRQSLKVNDKNDKTDDSKVCSLKGVTDTLKDNPLKQFKLFILLRFRDLGGEMDLVDAIFDQLLPVNSLITKEGLGSFIKRNPEKICVCLEALDEKADDMMQPDNTGNITKIVFNQAMRQSLLIITSRSSNLTDLREHRMSYTEAEITGFTSSNVEAYINRYFQTISEEGACKVYELIEAIRTSSALSKLANNPLILYLICLLWNKEYKLPDTLSRIYDDAVGYMVKRFFEKSTSSNSQEAINDIINVIGRVGIEGLVSEKNRMTFDEGEFQVDILQYVCKIGLLSKDKVRAGLRMQSRVKFLHKSIQEYCAARYWKSLVVSNVDEFNRYLNFMTETTKRAKEFLYVLQFGCCVNLTSAFPILQKLSSMSEGKGDIGDTEEIFLLCYFEAQVGHVCELKLSDWLFADGKIRFLDTIVLRNSSVDLMRALVYLLQSCRACDTCKEIALKIKSLNINDLPESSAEILKDLLSHLPRIDRLELFATAPLEYEHAWIVGLSDQDHLMTEISKLPLKFLFIGYFNLGSSITKLLFYTKHLKTLKMVNCFFLDELTDPKEFSADLQVLDFTSSNLSEVGARVLLGLNQMKGLEKLSLGLCSLDDEHIPFLTELLPSFQTLTILDVSHNNFGPESLYLLLKSIDRLRLREIYATQTLEAPDVPRFFHQYRGKEIVCRILHQMRNLELFLLDSFSDEDGNVGGMGPTDYEDITNIGNAHPALLRFRLPGLNMERSGPMETFTINDEYGIKALDPGGMQHMFTKESLAKLTDPEKDLLAAKTTRLMLSMTPEKLQEQMEDKETSTSLTTEQVGRVLSTVQQIFLSTNPLEALQMLQSVAESDDEEYDSEEDDEK